MKRRPKPAPAHWPYLDHRTVAEIEQDLERQRILDSLGKMAA